MKKVINVKVLSVFIILIVFLVGTYVFLPSQKHVIQNDHAIFNSAEKLSNYADAIIIGEIIKNPFEYKPTIKYNSEGRVRDFYTIVDVKHSKVLKGDIKKSVVPVIQGFACIDKKYKMKDDMLIYEDVSLMQKNKKYLLFLKKTDIEGVYSIVSLNQGKFNIDNLDEQEKKMENKNTQYKNLKEEILKKFKNKL